MIDAYKEPATSCEMCRAPIQRLANGRPRRFCSDACRAKSYRNRAYLRLGAALAAAADQLAQQETIQ